MTQTIDVVRSPLVLYKTSRVLVLSDNTWVSIFDPVRYAVAATPVEPAFSDETAAIITHAYLSCASAGNATVDVRIRRGLSDFWVATSVIVPSDVPFNLAAKSAILNSAEEDTLQVRVSAGPDVYVHLSYIEQTQERVETV